ncbi:MAG: helix-turn-helix domain-containing protein [Chloroflexota bacterium]
MALGTPARETALWTVDEVAAFLRISRAKAYAMAAAGDLPTVRMGRSVRVRRDRLDAWLDARSK